MISLKTPFLRFTKSMVLKKHSPLTPFFATIIMKLAEYGITDIISKRFYRKHFCPMDQKKGKSLGMEKFAPLFTIYLAGCIMSVTILMIEIIFEKSRPLLPKNVSGHSSKVGDTFPNNENHHSTAVRLDQTCWACGAKQFKSDLTTQK